MHEFGIMQEVVHMALTKANEAGANRIHRIRVEVGSLSGVIPEAMQFAHEVVSENTLADGSTLEIQTAPVVCFCAQCRIQFSPQQTIFRCPSCHHPSADIRSGRQLHIIDMEIS